MTSRGPLYAWALRGVQRGEWASIEAASLWLVAMTSARDEKVSRTTIAATMRGCKLRNLSKAQALSRATNGAVSVGDLMQ